MSRHVTELYTRSDWGFVKFAYVPVLLMSVVTLKFVPGLVAVRVGFPLCGLCALFARWGNHVEEWYNAKPLLRVAEHGLIQEDGGPPILYPWADITDVALFRRVAPWLANGTVGPAPPFWLAIRAQFGAQEHVITVWPREVRGGLMALRRFAASMKRCREEASASPLMNEQLTGDATTRLWRSNR